MSFSFPRIETWGKSGRGKYQQTACWSSFDAEELRMSYVAGGNAAVASGMRHAQLFPSRWQQLNLTEVFDRIETLMSHTDTRIQLVSSSSPHMQVILEALNLQGEVDVRAYLNTFNPWSVLNNFYDRSWWGLPIYPIRMFMQSTMGCRNELRTLSRCSSAYYYASALSRDICLVQDHKSSEWEEEWLAGIRCVMSAGNL